MADKILVTGASGFTGGRLVRRLVSQGETVLAMVRPTSNLQELQQLKVEPVICDLAQDEIPPYMLQDVHTVFHLAAVYRTQGVPDSYFYNVHARGTQRLMEAALQAGVKRFVHVSTVGVHGNIKNPPADENAPYNPGDIYQQTKVEGERIALDYIRNRGLPGTVIRPAGIYGPGDTRFLKLFRGIQKGIFWMIGDGETLYHMTYVDDLIDGMILAAKNDAALGEVFILGGKEPVTIACLVEMIARVLQRPVPRRKIPVGPVMLAARVCEGLLRPLGIDPPLYPRRLDFFIKDRSFNVSKARRILGYEPKVNLLDGLASTAAWYRQKAYLR